jgi:molybdopterin/thiamine biosynthesis adenylyltransferase
MIRLKKNISINSYADKLIVGQLAISWLEYENTSKALDHLKEVTSGISPERIKEVDMFIDFESKGWLYSESPNIDYNSRQFWYNDLNNISNSNEQVLKTKCILVFGCGGAGSVIVHNLAQLGVGTLILVDNDIITISDCHRTPVFRFSEVSKYKVDVLGKTCKQFGAKVKTIKMKMSDEKSFTELLAKYNPDLVVKSMDPNVDVAITLNEVCFRLKIPYYSCSYNQNNIKLGPLYLPGQTSCYLAIINYAEKKLKNLIKFKEHTRLFTNELFHPSINFNINTCASLAVKDIYLFLSNRLELLHTVGTLIQINTLTYEMHAIKIKCQQCTICQK